jgi:DNA-binding NarL/FixJ family response regulator
MPLSDARPPIRILLANHQPIVRNGLRLLLERDPTFQVVAEAADGKETIKLADFKRPDVTLLEIELPQVNGIGVAKEILSGARTSKVLFVTAHTDVGYVIEAFKAGACGYVAGDSAPVDLARAIHVVASGGLFLSPAICANLLEGDAGGANMSTYEKDLCCLTVAGYSESEIAAALNADVEKIRVDRLSFKILFDQNILPDILTQCILAAH